MKISAEKDMNTRGGGEADIYFLAKLMFCLACEQGDQMSLLTNIVRVCSPTHSCQN
jgi:hypothetical protein